MKSKAGTGARSIGDDLMGLADLRIAQIRAEERAEKLAVAARKEKRLALLLKLVEGLRESEKRSGETGKHREELKRMTALVKRYEADIAALGLPSNRLSRVLEDKPRRKAA